jgi:hypothetical protein
MDGRGMSVWIRGRKKGRKKRYEVVEVGRKEERKIKLSMSCQKMPKGMHSNVGTNLIG